MIETAWEIFDTVLEGLITAVVFTVCFVLPVVAVVAWCFLWAS